MSSARTANLSSSRPRRAAAPREWWQSHFDANYLREYEPLFTAVRDRAEAARLVEVLELPNDSRVLDVPCGQGRHAHLLAEAGFDVTGLDYSADLLRVARARGTGKRLRYVRGDMRRLPPKWTGRFDAVLNLFTSFGFFLDPGDDARVIGEFARVLAPGGVLVWHGGSRDGVMAKFLSRDWWRTDDGTMIAHQRSFDPLSGVLSVHAEWRGPKDHGERGHRIRLYTASRIAELCAAHGLIVERAHDGWSDAPLTRRSSEMLLVARKDELPRGRRGR
jgi:SAM-dependent methyltransferase